MMIVVFVVESIMENDYEDEDNDTTGWRSLSAYYSDPNHLNRYLK
jgi:hypothetical protein